MMNDTPRFLHTREFIHNTLAHQCICYFESKEAAIPMADRLRKRVVYWDKWYYIMPKGYNPAKERAEGKPHAWFCYTPKTYTED